jgi:hypothetical protein
MCDDSYEYYYMEIKAITSWYTRNVSIPAVFYIDWPNDPEFVSKPPDKSKFVSQINCDRMGEIIYLYASESTEKLLKTPYKIKQESLYKNSDMCLLKSHIQKCIRRCLPKKALQTAYSMFLIREMGQQTGLKELLRRLLIITIEDAILTKNYLKLTWLMSATHKDIKLPQCMIEWIFGYVQYLAETKWNDTPNMNLNVKIKLGELLKDLTPNHRSLLLVLQLRANYGGMSCDVKMLDNMSTVWRERFLKKDGLQYAILETEDVIKSIELKDLKILLPENIILPAIDYHCCNMIAELHEKTGIKKKELEKLIWENRSSVNHKIANTLRIYSYDPTTWNKISELVDEMSKNFIEAKFGKEAIDIKKKIALVLLADPSMMSSNSEEDKESSEEYEEEYDR